jgi:hypothetical protein
LSAIFKTVGRITSRTPDMAKGPKGQKRPADLNRRAFEIVRIASGEADEAADSAHQRKGGAKGGPARARALTPEQRSAIARAAASARWKKGG